MLSAAENWSGHWGLGLPGRGLWATGPVRRPVHQRGLCWQENVSLADILSLRDSGLSEQEAWAVCLECSLSMRSVAHSAIFHTLCITPDTLAFNTSGNVCFMEQLSGEDQGMAGPGQCLWGGRRATRSLTFRVT